MGLAGLVVVGFVVLRFWTTSQLWLDEAQTVGISRLGLTSIPGALRHDGSPPLFYFVLHFSGHSRVCSASPPYPWSG